MFHGRFIITEEMVNADTVAFFIERLRAGVEIQVDDIVIQKYVPSCSPAIGVIWVPLRLRLSHLVVMGRHMHCQQKHGSIISGE